MDITEFYATFFEEAEELLNDMETQLLELDVDNPDPEQLNAIFRAAHSIKGGAGTFGFDVLQHTTHLLENLLDYARQGELKLRKDLVDTFLETKDMLSDQLDAYREQSEPDPEAYERICKVLQKLAEDEIGQPLDAAGQEPEAGSSESVAESTPAEVPEPETVAVEDESPKGSEDAGNHHRYSIAFLDINEKDRLLLLDELEHLGHIESQKGDDKRYESIVTSTESADDIEAVLCFVVGSEQLDIQLLDAVETESSKPEATPAPAQKPESQRAPEPAPAPKKKAAKSSSGKNKKRAESGSKGHHQARGDTSIRVPVAKVDQIINLVGELIITQSMLNQVAEELGDTGANNLLSGVGQLQRNARDLQEAVMSIRMVPMDYVFSRFPRLVRDLAGKLDKEVELVTKGRSTELDKSLTERIIDPLTHLVRNSLDHGLEHPDEREAVGKPRTGILTLSAEHQGGNIVIEVQDDGGGMHRDVILQKAKERDIPVSDSMPDEEVWALIFAPGFSTAAQVSDVSGRGVGMDVVKRNIEAMGGHVQVASETGKGTTIRIILPLTLAILDGMSIKVGKEMFILPLGAVLESLQPSKEDLYAMAGGDPLLKVREDYLPLITVHNVMGVDNAETDPTKAIAVIVQGRGQNYALLVDQLIGQQQVVVKNLETNYRKVPGVSAATILGDGSVALILDVNGLHKLDERRKRHQAAANDFPKKPTNNEVESA